MRMSKQSGPLFVLICGMCGMLVLGGRAATQDLQGKDTELPRQGAMPAAAPVGAIPFTLDQKIEVRAASAPFTVNGREYRRVGVSTGVFHMDQSHLTAVLKAGILEDAKVDYYIYAAVFDAKGHLLAAASHKEPVEYISLGRSPMELRDIPLDFGVSRDFKGAAFVAVTISNPVEPKQ